MFLDVGGFGAEYKTGFEDIDLCLKLRMLGYRHYVANRSKIWHKRSSTPERNDHQSHNSKVFYGRWGKVITRFEEWERANGTFAKKKKQYAHIIDRPESFLFSDRELLIQNFQLHLRNKSYDQTDKILRLLKENFTADDDLVLLESQLLRKSGNPSKAKALFGSKPQSSARRAFDLEEALLARDLGEVTKARRKFLSIARGGFRPGLCYLQIAKDYFEQKKFEKAKEFYQKALIFLPDDAKSWSNLASVYKHLGDRTQEIKALQKSFSLNPKSRSIFSNLFRALTQFGAWKRAYDLCIRSKEINIPKECLLDFSKSCIEIGDLKTANSTLNRLIKIKYDVAEAHFLKGNLMVLLKQFSHAVENYFSALEYSPDWPEALSNLYNSKTFLCDWGERKKEIETLRRFHDSDRILGGSFELAGLYWSEEEDARFAQFRVDKVFAETDSIRKSLKFDPSTIENGKKRIGFLSSDFRNHAVGHQIVCMLENLDREKYELFLYATSPEEDTEVRKRIEEASEISETLVL